MSIPSSGTFTLLLFASASSYCADTESLTLPAPTDLASLVRELESRFPGVGRKVLVSCQVVRNLDYVDVEVRDVVEGVISGDGGVNGSGEKIGSDVRIQVGDEIAFVPPVSSG